MTLHCQIISRMGYRLKYLSGHFNFVTGVKLNCTLNGFHLIILIKRFSSHFRNVEKPLNTSIDLSHDEE